MESDKKQKIIVEFIKQLNSSITLPETDVRYWKTNAPNLPLSLVRYFSNYLKKENAVMAKNIAKAIKNEPKIVLEMKMKKKNIIKKVSTFYSQQEDTEAEKSLLEDLNQTND